MKKLIYTLTFLVFANWLNAQWVQISNGMGNYKNVYSFAFNGTNIFAGTDSGIYRSSDYGVNWLKTAMFDVKIQSLSFSENNLLAGTDNTGIYFSSNNGNSWAQSSLDNRNVLSLYVNGNEVFAGTNFGVYISMNSGVNWAHTSLNYQTVYSFATTENYIYAGTGGAGVFISTNNGITWSQSSMNNQYVYSMTVVANKIFAGTFSNGVFISTDNGENWLQTSLNSKSVLSLVIDSSYIFSGTDSTGIYFSSNDGVSWFKKNQGFNIIKSNNALLITNSFIFTGNSEQAVWRRNMSEIINVRQISELFPYDYILQQNFPNPFNPETHIRYGIPKNGLIRLVVFDILGHEIITLFYGIQTAGEYEVIFKASELPSGVYYYKLIADDISISKSMLLLK